MSKFLAIEQAIQQCGEGQFEKVVGQVLHARGVRGLSMLGSVIGKHKTRTGVPDAFASTSGERFSMLAATTATGQTALKNKLHQDISDCSDPDKTGISLTQIDRLYIAFNSVLPADVVIELATYSSQRGVVPEFLSLSEIAGDIARLFPWIARDEFGISVDTGQILSIDAFVERYDRGMLATPLSTPFQFRQEAMENALDALGTSDLLISGAPGTGKTRFALEIARRSEQLGAKARCILSQGLPLYEDIARHFSEPHKYIVVVDDANRVNGIKHLLHEALRPNRDRHISFVLTVRDYARSECMTTLQQLGRPIQETTLTPFTRDETDAYIAKSFGITNSDYQRQIWLLSRGNARLATMASRQAASSNRFDSISNVTELYEAYYEVLVRELENANPTLLRVLGLTAVFRVVRADDIEFIRKIEMVFGLRAGQFWESIDRLHGFECVDLHGRRIAKCSDQVLAGFAFYLRFVARGDLSFDALITEFSGTHLNRIRDSVYGALSTMDRDRVLAAIGPGCQAAMMRATDCDSRLKLMESFWFIEPDLVLTSAVRALEAEEPLTGALEFQEQVTFHSDIRLRILARFAKDPDRMLAAADAAVNFALRQPPNAGSALSLFTTADGFGVDKRSARSEYACQNQIAKLLVNRTESESRLAPLLAKYVGASLSTEFEANFAEGDRVYWTLIPLHPCEGLADWRRTLWNALQLLCTRDSSVEVGRYALRRYAYERSMRHPEANVLLLDVEWACNLFRTSMRSDRFEDCLLARAVGARLRCSGNDEFDAVARTFRCKEIELLEVTALRTEQQVDTSYEERVAARRQRVVEKFGAIAPDDLHSLAGALARVASNEPGAAADVAASWKLLLDHIGEVDPGRLEALTDSYLAVGGLPNLVGESWMSIVVGRCGRQVGSQLLSRHEFAGKRNWLITFYLQLQSEDITNDDAKHLVSLLAPPGVAVPWLHRLRGFCSAVPTFLPDLISALLEQRGKFAGEACRELLDHVDFDLAGLLAEQFSVKPDVLANAYLDANSALGQGEHFDYSAAIFGLLLNLVPNFLLRYVRERLQQEPYLSMWSEQRRNYAQLWKRPDWSAHLHQLLLLLAEHEEYRHSDYFAAWLPFSGSDDEMHLPETVLSVLLSFIQTHAHDQGCMEALFCGLVEVAPAQRLQAIGVFLKANQDAEAFAGLKLLPSHWGGSGSMVPVLQRRVEFLQTVMGMLRGPSFIAHRIRVSEEQRAALRDVDRTAEREFSDDD